MNENPLAVKLGMAIAVQVQPNSIVYHQVVLVTHSARTTIPITISRRSNKQVICQNIHPKVFKRKKGKHFSTYEVLTSQKGL